jgi:hypothetical protein
LSSAAAAPGSGAAPGHFIPVRRSELVARLLRHPAFAGRTPAAARLFAGLGEVFHLEFHHRAERLKELYAPLDPNADTVALPSSAGAPVQAVDTSAFPLEFEALLQRANFHRVSADELALALRAESVFKVKLHTELGDFAELILWQRGLRRREETVRTWFGLRRRTFPVDYFERVVLYVRFQDAGHFPAKRLARLPFKPGSTVLKLFENIPVADLEMLFPNSEVRMKPIDQMVLGVPALIGGFGILTQLTAALLFVAGFLLSVVGLSDRPADVSQGELVALGAAAFTVAIFASRQLGRFRFRKLQFLKTLADSLYFRNLDNNAGVVHRLVDSAEEEEVKEAMLGWAFLDLGGPATAAELDARVEGWFRDGLRLPIDFEVDDALAKLERLGLVAHDGERWRASTLDDALATLSRRWSESFGG